MPSRQGFFGAWRSLPLAVSSSLSWATGGRQRRHDETWARHRLATAHVCAYNAHMRPPYDVHAPKRPVNMTLNEDLVRCAREYATNLSDQVEKLLAEFVAAERRRRTEEDQRLDAAIAAWNAFDEAHGGFADEHADL
jgi:antitoxin CcdA